jgi:hypothetical protein
MSKHHIRHIKAYDPREGKVSLLINHLKPSSFKNSLRKNHQYNAENLQ